MGEKGNVVPSDDLGNVPRSRSYTGGTQVSAGTAARALGAPELRGGPEGAIPGTPGGVEGEPGGALDPNEPEQRQLRSRMSANEAAAEGG